VYGSHRLRAVAGVVARAVLTGCVACGLASGLDSLKEVPCVGSTCGDGAGPADGDDGRFGDSSADADSTSDASGLQSGIVDQANPPVDGSGDVSRPLDDSGLADAASESSTADGATCAPPRDASACTGNLSNIGTGNFHISLTLTATQQGMVAVVNQRGSCGGGMYWDLRLNSGRLMFETDDGMLEPDGAYSESPRTTLIPNNLVNDGDPHCIMIARAAEVVSISIDGIVVGSTSSVSSFGVLPSLATGTDPCEGTEDMTMALTGTVSGLCVGGP
jgi:hypothetical protein